MNGIFMAYGAAIQPGAHVEDASLVDLAPTILHLMSAPIPANMDGRILHDALDPGFEPASIVQTTDWQSNGSSGSGLSDDEKRIVAERLRGLGYVG